MLGKSKTDNLNVKISDIEIKADQPRKYFDSEKLADLIESIKKVGIIQPVILKKSNNKIILIAGERRVRAAKEAGLDEVPAYFVDGDSNVISLIENLQREDLNPIEEAEALVKLVEESGFKDKDLIPILGKAKSTISEIKKLAKLPDIIKEECRQSNSWSRNILLEIAKQPNEKAMLKLFKKVKEKNLKGGEVRAITRQKEKNRDKILVVIDHIGTITKSFEKIDTAEMNADSKKQFKSKLQEMREKIDMFLKDL
jgi:ParB family transcriptional regulator, chromosome partitioning protein